MEHEKQAPKIRNYAIYLLERYSERAARERLMAHGLTLQEVCIKLQELAERGGRFRYEVVVDKND